MSKQQEIMNNAIRIFENEANAILNLRTTIQYSLISAIQIIENCSGHILIFGVGKSGIIGEKIAASFSSLGTPSIFIHATEAVHGDMGKIRNNDVCIFISHSGESPEIVNILNHVKKFGNKLISITGNKNSFIAKSVNINIDTGVDCEADIRGLAPTTSAIATLAIGDALALIIADLRGFTKSNFHKFHPGGNIGKLMNNE